MYCQLLWRPSSRPLSQQWQPILSFHPATLWRSKSLLLVLVVAAALLLLLPLLLLEEAAKPPCSINALPGSGAGRSSPRRPTVNASVCRWD
jgi:hypothetical protein